MRFHKMNHEFDWGDFVNRYTTFSENQSSPEREPDQEARRLSISPVLGLFGSSPDKQFCKRENVEQCVAFLNQELVVLGFSSLFTPSHNGKGPNTFNIVNLVNNTYELLQLQQKNTKVRTDLEERNLRLDCDNEHFIQAQARLKDQLESAEREIAMGNERERQLHLKIKKLKEDVKSEKEEMKKTKANSLHLQKQYDHEARKREREMVKLKDRMHQLLADKSQDRKIGIDILNLLQRGDGKRALWRTGEKGMEDMYRLLITNYEQKQKELMVENNDLRDSLRAMQGELVDILNLQNEGYNSDLEDVENSEDGSVLSSGHFDMPYDLVREGIESSLREKWRILRSKLDNANRAANTGIAQTQQEIKTKPEEASQVHQLRQQLENYRQVVEQQEELLLALQSKEDGGDKLDSSMLSESWLCRENETLGREKQLLREQQETFENERKNFTEAVINFGEQRKQFEEDALSILKQQLVTPQKRSLIGYKKTRTPSCPKLQHSTAVFSPAPRHARSSEFIPGVGSPRDGIPNTPSTENLYRMLGLKSEPHITSDVYETPCKPCQTSLSPGSQPSSADSSGSKENHYDLDPQSKQAKRISQHAVNVKRALEQKQEKSPSGD